MKSRVRHLAASSPSAGPPATGNVAAFVSPLGDIFISPPAAVVVVVAAVDKLG